jgi:bifunctional non-homologous end joining protein LigD
MTLEKYKAKRDFRKTSEPKARVRKKKGQPIFVVQEHHASRHHYDFRLEADGVLKSWAVPKGPSMDPSQKRLAVHVEDHPLDYADFEGTIPEGEYGAGTVAIWDRGTYDNLLAHKHPPLTVTEGIAAGRLEFFLSGKKLRGRFALIRLKGQNRGKHNWLLIKMKDEYAVPETGDGEMERPQPRRPQPSANRQAKPPAVEKLPFTHPDKVMYPESGITKADILLFYGRISEYLLPHLRDRPITLERFPDGIGGAKAPHFWQKNTPAYFPSWVPRINLPSEGKPVHYVLVNDVQTLLYLVNLGALTFHVWLSRIQDLDRPDYVLFDLDPGQASFADAVTVAKKLNGVLTKKGQKAFLKTSGKSGLHVLVAWKNRGDYEQARPWALKIAEEVADLLPRQATTERSKARREERVYIDVMQNARGRHVVPPYVLRAVPGAPVSTPLSWRDLTPKLAPASFNLKTIFRRLSRQKKDLMEDLVQ